MACGVDGSATLVGADEIVGTADEGINFNERQLGHYRLYRCVRHSGACENTSDGGWDVTKAGQLTASKNNALLPGPATLNGDAKFHRLDIAVVTYGNLQDGNGHTGVFSAQLQFTPTRGTGLSGDSITVAALTEVAEIGTSLRNV